MASRPGKPTVGTDEKPASNSELWTALKGVPRTTDKDTAEAYLKEVTRLHDARVATNEQVRSSARQSLAATTAFFALIQTAALGTLRFAIAQGDYCDTLFDTVVYSAVIAGLLLGVLAILVLLCVESLREIEETSVLDLRRSEVGMNAAGKLVEHTPYPIDRVLHEFAQLHEKRIADLEKIASSRHPRYVWSRRLVLIVLGVTAIELGASLFLLAGLGG